MNNFYIADLHFGHANIIRFDKRPFDTVEDMDDFLISNWNSKIQQGDTTHILGDFCWGKEPDWIRILDILNGNKVLIRGNHDLKQMSSRLKNKFLLIKDRHEVIDHNKRIILSHYPEMAYKKSYDPNVFMFHGHVHFYTSEARRTRRWIKEIKDSYEKRGDSYGNIINVGCMTPEMDYTPQTAIEIFHAHGYCLDED